MPVTKHQGLYLFKRKDSIHVQARRYTGCWVLWYDRRGGASLEHQICSSAVRMGKCPDCVYTAEHFMLALEVFYTEILARRNRNAKAPAVSHAE